MHQIVSHTKRLLQKKYFGNLIARMNPAMAYFRSLQLSLKRTVNYAMGKAKCAKK